MFNYFYNRKIAKNLEHMKNNWRNYCIFSDLNSEYNWYMIIRHCLDENVDVTFIKYHIIIEYDERLSKRNLFKFKGLLNYYKPMGTEIICLKKT